MTGQDPGVVPEPIVQVQVTSLDPLAVSGSRPWAFDGPDLYSTMMAHEAPAAVRAASVAEAPRDTGELMLEIVTVIAPLGGTFVGCAVGAGVAVPPPPPTPEGGRWPSSLNQAEIQSVASSAPQEHTVPVLGTARVSR